MKRGAKALAGILAVLLLAGCKGVPGDGNSLPSPESSAVTVTLADGATSAQGDGVTVDGDVVTFTRAGQYRLTGSLQDGQLRVEVDSGAVELVLAGVTVARKGEPALTVESGDAVTLALEPGTENVLTSTGKYADSLQDGTVAAAGDLTLAGEGSLEITSGKGKAVVADGNLTVEGGTLTLRCDNDGLHTGGDLTVAGGNLTVVAGDDGLHADGNVTVSAGTVSVTAHEGLEGERVSVSGGSVELIADDDGINAAGESPDTLSITGGTVRIVSQGDCLDANGGMVLAGGSLALYSAGGAENGLLDSKGQIVLRGGTLLGAAGAGEHQPAGGSSAQGSVLAELEREYPAGTTVTLKGADGRVLATFAAEEAFSVVQISTPEMEKGESYTLLVGEEEITGGHTTKAIQ